MYFLEKILDLVIGQEYSLVAGLISLLVSYLIYQQHNMSKEMQKKWAEIQEMIRDNREAHEDTQEQVEILRMIIKEDILPPIRHMEGDLHDLDSLYRALEEAKNDQRGWFTSLRDDFNQFRSEFRDILKLVLNGRKKDC